MHPMGSADSVMRDVVSRIQRGEWLSGHRIPSERELCASYRVARNTVRRALKALQDEGLLVRYVGRGTFVRSAPEATVSELLGGMETASPADVMEVRLIIEPQAAALAAQRAGADDLAQIESALEHSLAAEGTAEFEHWDGQLHYAIFRATKNGLLTDFCRALNLVRNTPRWYRLKQKSLNYRLRLLYSHQHSGVVTALKERDAEAAQRALKQHLQTVRDQMLSFDV